MAEAGQLTILRRGADAWNQWREENPNTEINLSKAKLSSADLSYANLSGANLGEADLSSAKLLFANLSVAYLSEAYLSEAYLSGADLSEADLSGADLSGADLSTAKLLFANLSVAYLSEANLSGAYLFGANLSGAYLSGAYLGGAKLLSANLSVANLSVANLSYAHLSYADLSGANLYGANLYGVNLCGAYLSGANLYASQALFTDFRRATLTGACICDWQIGSSTKFEGVKCDYIFRAYDVKKKEFTGRLPVDLSSTLTPGEFEQWIAVRQGALDTIDITFKDGIDWQSFFQSLQVARRQHPDANVVMQSVEERDGIFVARLRVETEVAGEALGKLKADIENQIKASYELQISAAREENLLLRGENRALDKVVEKLAMTSKYTIHGDVGNLADTNFGSMTTHINQNSEAIAQLIESLRTSAQTFPTEQKEDVLMEIDDLKEDLSKPEKQDSKRIGIRLKRLIAAGTVAATIAGGAATFSGNVNEFTENVLELGEKIGLAREDVLDNLDNPK